MPGVSVTAQLIALAALAAGLGYIAAVRRQPRLGVVATAVTIAFIPVWIGAAVPVWVPLASLVTGASALALVSRTVPRFTSLDLMFAFLVMCAIAPVAIGRMSISAVFGVVTVWATGYVFGRLALAQVDLRWVYTCFAVVFAVAGALAVVEAVTGWHGLSQWGPQNAARAAWGSIIERGSRSRAEGAFGSSIALGASMALVLPLAVESRLKPGWRLLVIALLVGGAGASLSRTGVLSVGLALALSVVLLRSPQASEIRGKLVGLGVAAAAVIVPIQLSALSQDSAQAASAAYRGDLVSLLQFVDLIGVSSSMRVAPSGEVFFGGYRSIDSQFVLFGLMYGWFVLLLFVGMLLVIALSVLSGRATAPEVAVLAQIPALASVALITQYAVLFWIVLGMAVTARAVMRPSRIEVPARARTGTTVREQSEGATTR